MKRTTKKAVMIEALRKSLGNVTIACKNANIGRKTHYEWMNNDSEYASQVEAVLDEQGDFVENQLLKAIQNGDTTAIIFYCKTRLRKRGYTEKQEIDLAADVNINCNFTE